MTFYLASIFGHSFSQTLYSKIGFCLNCLNSVVILRSILVLIIPLQKNVNIGHVNIWSLLAPIKIEDPTLMQNQTKLDLVKNHILQHDYYIFGISETW